MRLALPATLMLTPDLYAESDAVLFEDLDPALETSRVDLLYVTDRLPETTTDGALRYGFGRSHSLAFGSVPCTCFPYLRSPEPRIHCAIVLSLLNN